MIYPNNFEQKIGFSTVRADIARRAVSAMGAELAEIMEFSSDFDLVSRRLRATDEMLAIINSGHDIPLENVRDIRLTVNHIRVAGTFPTTQQTLELRRMLQSMADLRQFFDQRGTESDSQSPCTVLTDIVAPLECFPGLSSQIDRIIDRYGNVKDNASAALAELRSRLRGMDNAINSAMRRVLARVVAQGLVDKDVAPSMRDGRLVIPVQPMHKRAINGIVHDESSTGKTVFVEPAEVVEANNALRTLQIEEQREITRILVGLADSIRPHIPALLAAADVVGRLDFIHAKAAYAAISGAAMPVLEPNPQIEWYHACHPVLKASLAAHGKQVVPLDIVLSPKSRILVISGPNAGGKSVCLKTVGINQYMAQCGVLPVVYDNSHFGIFTDIFIDIGDDQSIENDLSTYSSHLANMKTMLRYGGHGSLLLVDEFGSGTEPQIGAAIAQAILGRFNEMGMWGVITTHYQNLKHFAEETPGLVNGSMLYDRQLMQPLFTLSIGTAGSSFALEIARKTGLPADIINTAQEIVGSDYVNMDRYLLDVARDKRYWENKRLAIRKKEKHLDEIIERYEADADKLRQKRSDIISEARNEARRIVEGTNATIERTILEIRRSQAEKETTAAARRRMSDDLARLTADDTSGPGTPKGRVGISGPDSESDALLVPRRRKNHQSQTLPAPEHHEIAPGDHVRLDGEGQVGTVISVDGRKATVAFGSLKTTVKTDRLKYTTAAVRPVSTTTTVVGGGADDRRARQLGFKQDIDIRGMRADEAIQAVTYFIDDAIQFNAGRVRILHGTGTGALRQVVRAYLATVPGVADYHDEHVQFGGTGVTVVDLQ